MKNVIEAVTHSVRGSGLLVVKHFCFVKCLIQQHSGRLGASVDLGTGDVIQLRKRNKSEKVLVLCS